MPLAVRLLFRLKPTWLRHLNSCKILEQDLGLIQSQEVSEGLLEYIHLM